MKKKRLSAVEKNNSVDARTTSRGKTEKDMDEQVHSGEVEMAGEPNNEDPDDRVHRLGKKPGQLKAEDHPEDPDDLVHENNDEDDE